MSTRSVHLPFGRGSEFKFSIDESRVQAWLEPPAPVSRLCDSIDKALELPIEFPPFSRTVVAGDRVALVLDRGTPGAAELVAGVWKVLQHQQIKPEDLLIIQPADLRAVRSGDPRGLLPREVAKEVRYRIHDPENEQDFAYLATSATGERIYLSKEVAESDLILGVGSIGFDPILGYRGTHSSLFPGLSNTDAMRRAWGGEQTELGPDDPRPLRQAADEVGWLLGVHFSIQVIPSSGGGVARVLAGQSEAVLKEGIRALNELWRVDVEQRAELVVIAVDADARGHGWSHLATALDIGRRIVARDGRILLLTELNEQLTTPIEIIREAHTPRDAVKGLRHNVTPEDWDARRIAQALERANVYLVSQLEADIVEDLFMVPLATLDEAARLPDGNEQCVFLGSAQHAVVQEQV